MDESVLSVTALLLSACERAPHSVALRMAEGEFTFAALEDASARLAGALRDEGVREGDVVALLMANSLDQAVLWFALNRLGAVHAPINTALVGSTLTHALTVADPRIVVCDAELLPAVRAALSAMPSGGARVIVRAGQSDGGAESPSLDLLMRSGGRVAPVRRDPLDVATLLFTSGTTGRSKACMLSNTYLVRQGQLHAKHLELRADDCLYSPFPLFHIDTATLTVLAAVSVTGTAAVGRRFSVSGFWDELRAFDVTVFNFMGATLSLIWKQEASDQDRNHRVRLAWGVPLPEWQADFEDRFGFPLYTVYGLTDGGVCVYDPLDAPHRRGTAGRVLPEFEVRICDEGLNELPPGRSGEILVRGRGPGLTMNGYFAMPEATAATIVEGWVRTSDIGSLDEDAFLTFEGRLSDSVRRRGENISAFEVEECARSHPGVLDAAAIGVPSELSEEDLKVVVVLREGVIVQPQEIVEHFSRVAPRHMVPRYVEIVRRLPMTPTAKVEKFRLKEVPLSAATWDSESQSYYAAPAE